MLRLKRSESGFSLVEILAVVGVFGVLSAIAIPSMRGMLLGYELNTARFDLAAKLGEARTNAIKRNRQTWLLVTVATGTLQVQMTDPASGLVTNIGFPKQLPPRVGVISGTPTQLIRFDTTGRPVDAAGVMAQQTLLLRHAWKTQTNTVTAATTGRITVN